MNRSHDAAGILIIDEQQRVLLVHQTYKQKHFMSHRNGYIYVLSPENIEVLSQWMVKKLINMVFLA
jgi:hypothetical protein